MNFKTQGKRLMHHRKRNIEQVATNNYGSPRASLSHTQSRIHTPSLSNIRHLSSLTTTTLTHSFIQAHFLSLHRTVTSHCATCSSTNHPLDCPLSSHTSVTMARPTLVLLVWLLLSCTFCRASSLSPPVGYAALYNGFASPIDVMTNSFGFVYVAGYGAQRVTKLASNVSGPALLTYTVTSTPATPIGYPFGVCLDSAQNVYVVDSTHNRIFKFNNAGEQQFIRPSNATNPLLNTPTKCAVDSADFMYISITNAEVIIKLSANGTQVAVFTTISPLLNYRGRQLQHVRCSTITRAWSNSTRCSRASSQSVSTLDSNVLWTWLLTVPTPCTSLTGPTTEC